MNKSFVLSGWLLVALMATVAAAVAAQERAPLMVTPAWLAEHLHDANLVLLHVGDKAEYEAAHIARAQHISYVDISTPHGIGLSLELPPVEQLKAAFEKRGISNDSRIVVYFGKDWVSPSTRTILTLTYVGLGDRTSLLDGGMLAWRAAGNPVTSEVKLPASGHFTPQLHPEVVVDAAWVAAHLHQRQVAVLDARLPKFYTGAEKGTMPRAGHIPGAQNIPFQNLVDDSNRLKDSSALAELFRAAGVKTDERIVTYCHIGQQATLLWFAAKLLGYDAYLYDGSWEDWSARKDLPIETSPAAKQNP